MPHTYTHTPKCSGRLHLVNLAEKSMMDALEGIYPFLDAGKLLGHIRRSGVHVQEPLCTIYACRDLLVKDQLHQQRNDLLAGNIDLCCQELQADATIRLDDVL